MNVRQVALVKKTYFPHLSCMFSMYNLEKDIMVSRCDKSLWKKSHNDITVRKIIKKKETNCEIKSSGEERQSNFMKSFVTLENNHFDDHAGVSLPHSHANLCQLKILFFVCPFLVNINFDACEKTVVLLFFKVILAPFAGSVELIQ